MPVAHIRPIVKVLLTGATSAAGQYILQTLMTTDHDVRVLALPDTMHRIQFRDRIDIVPGDLRDDTSLREAADGVELVFHTALVQPSATMDRRTLEALNIEGTERLVAAVAPSARRIVLVTSSAVYADHLAPALWPVTDGSERYPSGPPATAAFTETLIAAEDRFLDMADTLGFEHVILRPTLLGGRKAPSIEQLLTAALKRPDLIEGQHDVLGLMHWLHGSDLGAAALLVGEDPRAADRAFLAAGPEPITIYDAQRILWNVMHVGREDNPHTDAAYAANLGLPKYVSDGLHALGWRARIPASEIVMEALGRLDFKTSESLRLPAHLISEVVDQGPPAHMDPA